MNIRGERVVLRAVEPTDIDFMYGLENDIENWGVSGTTLPFSHYMLSRFVESQSEDIHATRQLRLMISLVSGELLGTVDLFEFDPYNHRAGVGIIIAEPFRGAGYATEALTLLHDYCRATLQLHQIWCTVESSNKTSLRLFERLGYKICGEKRDWLYREGRYHDEVMLQCIL